MSLVAAKCTECGAQIEVDSSKEGGVCKYCGTSFLTEKVINNYITNVQNNFDGATINVNGPKVEHMLKNGLRTYEEGNYEEAYKIFTQVLNFDSDCTEALLYRGLSAVYQGTIGNCRFSEFSKAFENAIVVLHKKYGNSAQYFEECSKGLVLLAKISNVIFKTYKDYGTDAAADAISCLVDGIGGTGAQIKNEAYTLCYEVLHNLAVSTNNILVEIINTAVDLTNSNDTFKINCITIASNALCYFETAVKYKKLRNDDPGLFLGLYSVVNCLNIKPENEKLFKKEEDFILSLINFVPNQTPERLEKYKVIISKHKEAVEQRLSQNKANIKKGLIILGAMAVLILIIVLIVVIGITSL